MSLTITSSSSTNLESAEQAEPAKVQFQNLPQTLRGERYYYLAYDTTHDKLRKKLSRACLDAGLFRVQYSVFVGCIKDLKAQKLLQELQDLVRQPLRPKDPIPHEPLAHLFMLRLDQGQSWYGLSAPHTRAVGITPLEQALRPKQVMDYVLRG